MDPADVKLLMIMVMIEISNFGHFHCAQFISHISLQSPAHAELIEIAEMAQLNPNILMNCLTKGDHNWRYNDSDSDLDATSATKIRNTICRTIYGRLFTWIAGKINESLKVKTISYMLS